MTTYISICNFILMQQKQLFKLRSVNFTFTFLPNILLIGGYRNMATLNSIPKSHVFTSKLPADPEIPTPEALRTCDRGLLKPRMVRNAVFTYVKPDTHDMDKVHLLAVSRRAMDDLGLQWSESTTDEFKEFVVGNKIFSEHCPWAQLYGGWQFGEWAGQLGDGRAISLFEATNSATQKRYEIQLKGAGLTPYSRFADGRAVLRSSIREFLISEALNALSIPTTRALALSYFENEKVLRERIEPRAIVARMAESWIRIGTFDIHYSRGDRKMLKILADYCINEVFGGIEKITEPEDSGLNIYHIFYKEVIRRTARVTAQWQAYGFMNGVLNTDNVSVYGLSLDFGPFSFMDTYKPSFTPNHDDYSRRYSYRNQPTIMWWNLVRFGEDLAPLFAVSQETLESEKYLADGLEESEFEAYKQKAEDVISDCGEYYKSVLKSKYLEVFSRRFGFTTVIESDVNGVIDSALDLMTELELDFHRFFRSLANIDVFDNKLSASEIEHEFLSYERSRLAPKNEQAAKEILSWIQGPYKTRLADDGRTDFNERKQAMNRVNPNFILRNWILDEVITRVQRQNDTKILNQVLEMVLDPFREEWCTDKDSKEYEDEKRFLDYAAITERSLTCSCSS
ncbi:hypothetical protein V1511DRAFT_499511 [Dipodascopsis uninucleata]